MKINKLCLKDVRCFAGEQPFEIRPLTFLTGENSTGKSTALACFQTLANFFDNKEINFNRYPYDLGYFGTIAREGKETFTLKVEVEEDDKKISVAFEFYRGKSIDKPLLKELKIEFSDGSLILRANKNSLVRDDERYLQQRINNIEIEEDNQFIFEFDRLGKATLFYLERIFHFVFNEISKKEYSEDSENAKYQKLAKFLKNKNIDFYIVHRFIGSTISFAPIRSKPARNYEPLDFAETPEGSEMPFYLLQTMTHNKAKWNTLQKAIQQFGKTSGMFELVEVKRYGESMSDPFQLQIQVRGVKSNLIDVGYGVSQILPILVSIFKNSNKNFLLQEPEVHLHPRAQAEFTTLLANQVNDNKKTFIIETHSDYMINRAIIEIKNKVLNPEDVSLIYCEPKGDGVKVHNIRFDKDGDFENAPDSYKKFFLDETDRLLGWDD